MKAFMSNEIHYKFKSVTVPNTPQPRKCSAPPAIGCYMPEATSALPSGTHTTPKTAIHPLQQSRGPPNIEGKMLWSPCQSLARALAGTPSPTPQWVGALLPAPQQQLQPRRP